MRKILNNKNKKIWSAALILAAFSMASMVVLANISGAIYTSLPVDGSNQPTLSSPAGFIVNANTQYPGKPFVFLNGGPRNASSAGISPTGAGTFYFQVTGTSSNQGTDAGVLVSADPAVCRLIDIDATGRIAGLNASVLANSQCPPRIQFQDVVNTTNPLQLCPAVSSRPDVLNAGSRYDSHNWCDTTPNTAGVYKTWIVDASKVHIDSDGVHLVANKGSNLPSKTDNFKVKPPVALKLSIQTEVDVTGFTEPAGVAYPVVTLQGNNYQVNHGLISSVTSVPGWSVTVQDRAIVKVNGAPPTGTVTFTLFNNDQCRVDSELGWTATPFGSSSSWTQSNNPNEYSSGYSNAFTFNSGGAWAFQATYEEPADSPFYGTVADLGCEAWPVPTISTAIYAQGNPNPVTGGNVLAGTTIYDTAALDTQDVDNGIPNGSSIVFHRYATINCTGSENTETVPLTGGPQTANVNSLTTSASPSYLSYRAVFISNNPALVPSVADNVCEPLTVVTPISVSKTVTPSLIRTYNWKIAKVVDSALKEGPGSSIFNYTVTASQDGAPVDSLWQLTGNISVSNSNPWSVTLGSLPSDLSGNGGACTVNVGSLLVAAGQTNTFGYTCGFAAKPSSYVGLNTATASTTDHGISINSTGTAAYDFNTGISAVNQTINVTDTFYGSIGSLTGTDTAPFASLIKQYPRTVSPAAGRCLTVTNTASVVEILGLSASANATACNTKTGALTIGYWQNKNGQGIILGGSATAGICNSGTWLRAYVPFQDLSATANCSAVAKYAMDTIKSANSSGTTMNAMLKAQMLATALDVYFSDATLGGNKINAPAPIGGVKINLTIIPESPGSSATENTSSVFGGSPKTVLQLLTAASSNCSTVGGLNNWYGQIKATQELAKDTFDAINNEVAPLAP